MQGDDDSLKDNTQEACIHCGTLYSPVKGVEKGFCCRGCQAVHRLIGAEGLEQFYNLKGNFTLDPVGGKIFGPISTEWLNPLVEKAETEAGDGVARLRLRVRGISCLACVWLLETLFERLEGALRLDVNVARGILQMEWIPGKFDPVEFCRCVHGYGYELVAPGDDVATTGRSDLGMRLGVCGALAMNAMAFTLPRYLGMPDTFMFATFFEIIAAVSATIAVLVGGSYFFARAWRGWQSRTLHIDTPVALGIIAAFVGSMVGWVTQYEGLMYFDFVALFILLMLAGRHVQSRVLEAHRQRVPADTVSSARYTGPGGGERAAADIKIGDVFRVKGGQVVPVGARLRDENASEFTTESINGESAPVLIEPGQLAPSGARALSGEGVTLEAVESWKDGLLCQLAGSVGASTRHRAYEKTIAVYLVLILIAGIAGLLAWSAVDGLPKGLQVMISVFVVSCPCALGVALPLADELAAKRLSAIGVYVRAMSLWSRLTRIKKVFFDKTGTLTGERPELLNPKALRQLDTRDREVLGVMVKSSLHPVSRTLAEELSVFSGTKDDPVVLGDVKEIPGRGLRIVETGNAADRVGESWTLTGRESGRAGTVFRRGDRELAAFVFQDNLRSGSVEALQWLRKRGVDSAIFSGDDPNKVVRVAAQLDLESDRALGGLSPEEKAEAVKKQGGSDALYVGDGVNDTLAAAECLCSGAMVVDAGAVLPQKTDFLVFGQRLDFLPALFRIARRRRASVRAAFFFAVIYNIICVSVALAGLMNPLLAAILMPLSSIVTLVIVS